MFFFRVKDFIQPRFALRLIVGLGVLSPGVAFADPPVAATVNVGAASDYEFRGISQTNNRPEIFGGVDATFATIGYAGAWVSNVDFQNGTRAEYDLYAGVKPMVGPVTVDLGVIRYGYTRQPSRSNETYTEWKVAPSMALGPATLAAAWFYSDQYFGHSGPANYIEVNGSSTIGKSAWSVSGAIGRQQVKGPQDYTTWNLGIGYAVNSHLGFDLRYWDTDQHGFGDIYKSKLTVSLKATFP